MISNGGEGVLSINGCKLYCADKETVQAYWEWLCSLPKPDNPLINNDGHKDVGQNKIRGDKMFFLSPSDSGQSHRFCEVPSGHKILIPSLCVVATGATGEGGERPNATVKDLIHFNEVDQKNIEFRRVKIDGQLIPEEYLRECRHSFKEEYFGVKFPEKYPIFNATPGACNAVADGVYLILDCPPESDKMGQVSKHTIHLEGKIKLPEEEEDSLETAGYQEDVFYTLVQKP